MNRFARIGSALVAASLALAPVAALAEPGRNAKDAKSQEEQERAHAKFPQKADDFRKHVEKRIEHAKARVGKAMDKRNLPAPVRAEVNKAVDAAVKEVHQAVDKAAADGVVTRDEARDVRKLAKELRGRLKAQLKGRMPKKERGSKA